MIEVSYTPVVVVALLCLMAFIRNKMDEAVQPMRLEMAEQGEALLRHPHLSKQVKESVRYCLDHAFGARRHLILEMMFIPFFALTVLFNMMWVKHVIDECHIDEKEARADATDFFGLYEQISWINNPLLMTITSLEFHIFVTVAIIIRVALLRGYATVEKWTVQPALEEFYGWFSEKIPLRVT